MCVSSARRSLRGKQKLTHAYYQFYEYGNGSVFQVAATANGVTYNPSTPIAQAGGSSSSSSATTGGALPFMRVTPAQLGVSFAVTAGVFLGALSVL